MDVTELGYHRKTFRIQATDSPNVRLGLAQEKRGEVPTDEILIPGVKPYSEYQKNLKMWPRDQQTVSLDADWYEGAEEKLFPEDWLVHSARVAKALMGRRRIAKAVGIDTGQGKANTALAAVDDLGLIDLRSKKTPKAASVMKMVIEFVKKHSVPWDRVFFDAGGGGHEHAGYMQEMGYPVRTIAFGGAATKEREPGIKTFDERVTEEQVRASYSNKRTEMYGRLSERMDPSRGKGFGVLEGGVYLELRRQMLPIPRRYDSKGRLWLPPKHKQDPNSTVKTIVDLIGYSPDELDALVLAVHGMDVGDQWATAGAGL